jgi:hypothetical protein
MEPLGSKQAAKVDILLKNKKNMQVKRELYCLCNATKFSKKI